MGLEIDRPAVRRIQMGGSIQAAEELVAISVCMEVGGAAGYHAQAHILPIYLCEIDVPPRLTHRIGQGLELMLLQHCHLLEQIIGLANKKAAL